MKHKKIAVMLSEFIDDRLSARQEKIVRQHLTKCAKCREMLHNFEMLHNAGNLESTAEVKPFFAQRVLREVNARNEEKVWQIFSFLPRPVIATGIAFSLVLLGFFMSPLLYPPADNYESEFALLFNGQTEINNVSDDEALAIALSVEPNLENGE